MKKIEIEISQCKPGMKIANTYFNSYGAVLIEENMVLDQPTIDRLEKSGNRTIRIFEEVKETEELRTVKIFQNYEKDIDQMKSVFHNLSQGKALEDKKVKEVVNNIVDNIGENRDIVKCLNQIREENDKTYRHSVNVSMLCMLIGKWFKYSESELKNLVQAGLLHDIGKVKIPQNVSVYRENFTKEEETEYLKHVIYGYEIANKSDGMTDEIKAAILYHHERIDGSGYPRKLKNDDIHEYAKIVSIADLYDNMTSQQKESGKSTPFAVFDKFEREIVSIMDYKIYNTFMVNIAIYYIGAKVMLNNGEIGEVIYMYPGHLSRPIVKVGMQFKDLLMEKGLGIVSMF